MSRAQTQTLQMTDQQLANANALNKQFLTAQQQMGNTLVPQFQSILNNPGLSSADQAGWVKSPVPRTRRPLRSAHQDRCSMSQSLLQARENFEWIWRSAWNIAGPILPRRRGCLVRNGRRPGT